MLTDDSGAGDHSVCFRSGRRVEITMLTIDGRTGGGQILRTALTLAALTQTPFRLERVRGAQPEPGLKPQHLAAVRAVADLCGAEVSGAEAGSESLTFQPGSLRPISLEIDIGTAGSITLLFDAVLPLGIQINDAFDLTATGGTDVKWSPTISYFEQVKLALLSRYRFAGAVELERTGFYPAGGGRATLQVNPSTLDTLWLADRGSLDRVEVFSKASAGLEDQAVADRQAKRAAERLEDEGLPVEVSTVEYVTARSDGSALLLRGVYDGALVGFDTLGERGKPSEAVAETATERFLEFHDGRGVVDEHMGDQLLVFLALVGGRIRTPRMTAHLESNAAAIRQFGFDLHLEQRADGTVVAEA